MALNRQSLSIHILTVTHRLSIKPFSGIWFGEIQCLGLSIISMCQTTQCSTLSDDKEDHFVQSSLVP